MAIEITIKPKVKVPAWATVLFIAEIAAVLAFTFFYFYLGSLTKDIEKQIAEKEKALAKTEEEKKFEEYIFAKEEKLNNFATILKDHKKAFNIFIVLELLTHPKVQYTNFNFVPQDLKVTLKGNTASMFVLGQQLLILKNEERIKEINLSGISIKEDRGVDFSLILTFDSGTFE